MLNLIVQVIKNTFYIINWNCYCFITIALGISLFKNLKFYWDYVTDAINVLFTVKIKTELLLLWNILMQNVYAG